MSTTSRPLIGLSSYREDAHWGVWSLPADVLPAAYARSVEAVGGVPVLVPPSLPSASVATAVMRRLDALVITGGADVNPSRYRECPHPQTAGWRDDRDAWELALLDAAEQAKVPVLGICRGMQLMAVHAGGTLAQHTPDLIGHHSHGPGGDTFGDITVHIDPASRLGNTVGAPELVVPCHHHQSVRSHPGYEAVAWAADGLLEGIEARGEPWRIAVQWHPEMTADAGLFQGLVNAVVPD